MWSRTYLLKSETRYRVLDRDYRVLRKAIIASIIASIIAFWISIDIFAIDLNLSEVHFHTTFGSNILLFISFAFNIVSAIPRGSNVIEVHFQKLQDTKITVTYE